MEKKKMIELISIGWNLRDWYHWHPETQRYTWEREVEQAAEALLQQTWWTCEKVEQ